MQECVARNYDPEAAHATADSLLEDLLDELGFGAVTFEYAQVKNGTLNSINKTGII
jgi:hypothetical protein